MLPLTSYSTSFVGTEASIELNNSSSITLINEDDERRYIRKVFHKIRNARKEKRRIDILMNSWVYNVINFNLNGIVFKRVILQIKNYNFTNIIVSKYEEVFAYNQLSGLSSTGLEFDNKLTLYFENEYDKKIAIDYISGKGNDDFIPAFSYFNLAKVDSEIIQRQSDPGLISQDPTPLCGIACVGNIIAKYFKLDFKYLIKDLFYYAEAFFGYNNYLIKPKNSITGQNYYINPKDTTYPQGMPQADFILLTSIKNSENKVFSYDGLYQFGGVSFPYELVVLLTKMLNCKEVNDRTSITGIGLNEMELLTDMNKDYNDGCECLMLINSNMLHDTTDGEFPNHWVNYKGKLVVNDVNKQVTFKLFTWGQGDNKQYTIKQEVFVEHFYGYINAKIK